MSIDRTAGRAWEERGAALYERGRPGYAWGALGWLVQHESLGPGRSVLDVGAGTGKLTRQLQRTGARVVAVEPLRAMRSRLPAGCAVGGVAEALPVRGGWADLVTVAQAFHWFRPGAAEAEIHRALRPRGRLALLTNDDSLEGDWPDLEARLREVLAELGVAAGEAEGSPGPGAGFDPDGLFSPLEERRFHHTVETDLEGLVARAASYSRVASLEPGRYEAAVAALRETIAGHPVVAGRRPVLLPQITILAVCTARA